MLTRCKRVSFTTFTVRDFESVNQAHTAHYGKISALECDLIQFSVQRKCEKLCTEKISFEPLSKRRHRFDLIQKYKFVNNRGLGLNRRRIRRKLCSHDKVTIRPGFSRTVVYFWILSWILRCPGFVLDLKSSLENAYRLSSRMENHEIWSVDSQKCH